MPLPRGRVTYCIASFRNCLHFRIAVQPRLNQHASAQSVRCQRKQKFSSQAIIWEHIKDLVSHANNLYNSWLVKQRKCSQKGFGFLLQAYNVAENLLFLACTGTEKQGQSSTLLDTAVRRSSISSNTGKLWVQQHFAAQGLKSTTSNISRGQNDTVTTLSHCTLQWSYTQSMTWLQLLTPKHMPCQCATWKRERSSLYSESG